MKIILFGAPASGKGTQGKRLADQLDLPHVSTGDMLRSMREDPGPIGEELRQLPPHAFARDELILKALRAELAKPLYAKGVILEGFPRTLAQAQAMVEDGLIPDVVINLPVSDEVVMKRATGRRIHPGSGRSYHLLFNPPREEGKDDVTGEPLIQRKDDHEEVVHERMEWFRDRTIPAIEAIKALARPGKGPVWVEVNADQAIDQVAEQVDLGLASARAIQALRHGQQVTVTIESPYAGDIEANEAYARAAMRDCLLRGEAPFASHLLYTQPGVLDDAQSAQRRLGVEAGLVFAQKSDKTVVYGDLGITSGMEEGIARAKAAGRPVEYRSLPAYAPDGNKPKNRRRTP